MEQPKDDLEIENDARIELMNAIFKAFELVFGDRCKVRDTMTYAQDSWLSEIMESALDEYELHIGHTPVSFIK